MVVGFGLRGWPDILGQYAPALEVVFVFLVLAAPHRLPASGLAGIVSLAVVTSSQLVAGDDLVLVLFSGEV